jgi:voltage-gated sodium channel
VNAIILGLQTDKDIFASYGPLLDTLDRIILAVFVIELLTRFYVFGWRMLKDPWSIFDIFVVGVALVPASGHLAVLRSLRILRALRLISSVPSMRRVVSGLLTAIPGMASIVMLLLLVLYVSAVMATQLFGAAFPESFGTLGSSVFTLIQIMTMEGWADISGPVMERYSYAWVFFLVYMLVTSFAVLNLFIGIIVDAMQSEALEPLQHEEELMIDEHTARILSEIEALRADVQALRDSQNERS